MPGTTLVKETAKNRQASLIAKYYNDNLKYATEKTAPFCHKLDNALNKHEKDNLS